MAFAIHSYSNPEMVSTYTSSYLGLLSLFKKKKLKLEKEHCRSQQGAARNQKSRGSHGRSGGGHGSRRTAIADCWNLVQHDREFAGGILQLVIQLGSVARHSDAFRNIGEHVRNLAA